MGKSLIRKESRMHKMMLNISFLSHGPGPRVGVGVGSQDLHSHHHSSLIIAHGAKNEHDMFAGYNHRLLLTDSKEDRQR
jgi:hypothetical protein